MVSNILTLGFLTAAIKSVHPFYYNECDESAFTTFFVVGYSETLLIWLSSGVMGSFYISTSLHIFLELWIELRVTLREISSMMLTDCCSLLVGELLYFSILGLFYYSLWSSMWLWTSLDYACLTRFSCSRLLFSLSSWVFDLRVLRKAMVSALLPSFVAIYYYN